MGLSPGTPGLPRGGAAGRGNLDPRNDSGVRSPEHGGNGAGLRIGQSSPLVAALWGVFIWHEFHGAPRKSHALVVLMFFLYFGAYCSKPSAFKARYSAPGNTGAIVFASCSRGVVELRAAVPGLLRGHSPGGCCTRPFRRHPAS